MAMWWVTLQHINAAHQLIYPPASPPLLVHAFSVSLSVQIEAAHAVLTSAHPLHTRMLWGTEHTPALQETCKAFHRLFPFDAKHALQNACIVGEHELVTDVLGGFCGHTKLQPCHRHCCAVVETRHSHRRLFLCASV